MAGAERGAGSGCPSVKRRYVEEQTPSPRLDFHGFRVDRAGGWSPGSVLCGPFCNAVLHPFWWGHCSLCCCGSRSGLGSPGRAVLFEQHCAGCHWGGGNIIRRGKTLRLAALQRNGITEPAAVAAIIRAACVGQMGSYPKPSARRSVEPVAAYVWQQAEANWPRSS